jgi:hypothetical protein
MLINSENLPLMIILKGLKHCFLEEIHYVSNYNWMIVC